MCYSTRDFLTLDHIIQLSAGGSNDKANLQLLCMPCHREKDGISAKAKERKAVKSRPKPIPRDIEIPVRTRGERPYYPKRVGNFWTLLPRPSMSR